MFGLGDLGRESARVSQKAAGRLKATAALEFSLGFDLGFRDILGSVRVVGG